jgi:hypothetical protein
MSSPRLTVSQARAKLAEYVCAGDPTHESFLKLLNQVCERFVDSGSWEKSDFVVELPAPNGYITLPRRASAMLGFRVRGYRPRRVFPLAHEFSEVGPGFHEFDAPGSSVYEMPDSCLHTDLPEAGTLIFECGASDAGKTVMVRGLDENGLRVFSTDGRDGLEVTLASPSVTTTQQFSVVESLTLPVTKGYVILKTGTTELGRYEPGETDPSYRRYKVGEIDSAATIDVLCSRRHVELVTEDDLVFPANIGALKNGLIALVREDTSDLDSATGHFNLAYSLLNAGLRRLRGKARPTPMFSPGTSPVPSFL